MNVKRTSLAVAMASFVATSAARSDTVEVKLQATVKVDSRNGKKKDWYTQVTHLAFSPDNETLAAALEDGHALLIDCRSGTVRKTLDAVSAGEMHCLTFSPDSKTLATGSADGTIWLWETATGQKRSSFQATPQDVWRIVFTHQGQQIVALGSERPVKRGDYEIGEARIISWEIRTAQIKGSVHIKEDCGGELAPDGSALVTRGFRGVKLWDAATGKERPKLKFKGTAFTLDFSPDGRMLVAADDEQQARIWEVSTGKELGSFLVAGPGAEYPFLKFSTNGKLFAARGERGEAGTVRFLDSRSGREVCWIELHKQAPLDQAAFSPDGKLLATANGVISHRDGNVPAEIKIWDCSRLMAK